MSAPLKEKKSQCQPVRQSDGRRRYRRRKAPPPTATLSLDATSLAVFAAQIKGLVDATVEQRFATIDRDWLLHSKSPHKRNPLLVPKLEPASGEVLGDCDDSMGFQFVAVNEPEDDDDEVEIGTTKVVPAAVELRYCLSTDSRLSDSLIYSVGEKQLYCLKNSYKKQKRYVCKTATCWSAVVLAGKVLHYSPNFAPHNHADAEQEAFELGFEVEDGKQEAAIDESFQLPSRNLRNLRASSRPTNAAPTTTAPASSSRLSVKSSKSPGQVVEKTEPKKDAEDDVESDDSDDSDDPDSGSGDDDDEDDDEDGDDSDDDAENADETPADATESTGSKELRYRILTGIRFNPEYEDNMIYVMDEKQIYRKAHVFNSRTRYICRMTGCFVSRYMYGKKLIKSTDLEHLHGDQAEMERKLSFNRAFREQCTKPGANPKQVYAALRKRFPKNIAYTHLSTLKLSLAKQQELQAKATAKPTRPLVKVAAKPVPRTKPIARPVKQVTSTTSPAAKPKPVTVKPAVPVKLPAAAAATRPPAAVSLNTIVITEEQALLLARPDCVSSTHKILAYRKFAGCKMLYAINEKQVYQLQDKRRTRSIYTCMVRNCGVRASMFGQVLRLQPNGRKHTHGTQEVYARLKDAAGGKRVSRTLQPEPKTATKSPPAMKQSQQSAAASVPSKTSSPANSARRRTATSSRLSAASAPAASPNTGNNIQPSLARSNKRTRAANNSPVQSQSPVALEMCPKPLVFSKGKSGSVELVYTVHEHQCYRLKHQLKGRQRFVCRRGNCRAEVFLFDDGQLRRPTNFRRHNHGRQMRDFDSDSPRTKARASAATGAKATTPVTASPVDQLESSANKSARNAPAVPLSNGSNGTPLPAALEHLAIARMAEEEEETLIEMAHNQTPSGPSSDDDDYDEDDDEDEANEASQSEQSAATAGDQLTRLVKSRRQPVKALYPGPSAYRHICSRKKTRLGNYGQLLYTIDEKQLYRLHDPKRARYSCRVRTCAVGFNMRDGQLYQATPGPLRHNHGNQEAYAARLERQAKKRPLGVQPILVKVERRPSGEERRMAGAVATDLLEYGDDDGAQYLRRMHSTQLEEEDEEGDDYVDMSADAIADEADDYVELEYRLANGEQVMRQSAEAGDSDNAPMVNVETADHIYCLTNGALEVAEDEEEMSDEEMSVDDGHDHQQFVEFELANGSLEADVDVESSMVDDAMFDDVSA